MASVSFLRRLYLICLHRRFENSVDDLRITAATCAMGVHSLALKLIAQYETTGTSLRFVTLRMPAEIIQFLRAQGIETYETGMNLR